MTKKKEEIFKVELAKPYRDGIEFGLGLATLWFVGQCILIIFNAAIGA